MNDQKCIKCWKGMETQKLLSDNGVTHRHLVCTSMPDDHPIYCKNEKRWIEL